MQERNIHFHNIEAKYGAGEPELFNPWDSFVIVTSEKITMLPIGSAGARDQVEYKIKFSQALHKVEDIYNQSYGDVEILLLSALNSNSTLENGGLGIDLNSNITEFSVEEFQKIHPGISPKEYILDKCTVK